MSCEDGRQARTTLRRSALSMGLLLGLAGAVAAQQQRGIVTLATTEGTGRYGRVDLVDGGLPAGDPGALTGDHAARRAFLEQLTSFALDPLTGQAVSSGLDLDGDLADSDGDGLPDSGFDSYAVGLAPADGTAAHRRIIGANNLYDLFQTTLGGADPAALGPGFAGFTGGDADADGEDDGGPGLFSNAAGSLVPELPLLPAFMGAGRGGQPGEQHQFVQIVFPYALDVDSLFDLANGSRSFLADTLRLEARWVERGADGVSVVDQTDQHRHVPVVAIIGGLTALPAAPGASLRATVDGADPALSGIPVGARQRIYDANVLTLIAHEDPASLVTAPNGAAGGFIDNDATLRLPSAERGAAGGRVFGANQAVPDAVNDFAVSGRADAAPLGFLSLAIASLRRADGTLVPDAYFHSVSVSQAAVGADPRAPAGGFDRGPALAVDAITGMPAITVLDAADPGSGDGVVSTRARFRVDFDREVVPNSVGFSRRHTLQRTDALGVVLPFDGNTAPLANPGAAFVPGADGGPVAPSVYLAVNQATQVAVNNPFVKDADGDGLLDDGVTPIDAAATTPALQAALNGLHPPAANALASLPRGVVPCDVYPVNQDNLQAYIVEPLIELPAGAVVTLGVCRQGLGTTALGLTNVGNYTVAGTLFSPFGNLSPVGQPDPSADLSVVAANEAVIKVNAGPMDLYGRLFTGSTDVVRDTLINGDPQDDLTTGGFNVSRSFAVGRDAERPAVNAPVAPEALYTLFGAGGAGVVDLNGRGFTTNAPDAGLSNPETPFVAIVSRSLPPSVSGLPDAVNWKPGGALAAGSHVQAFGLTARHATGACACVGESIESELAVAAAVGLGDQSPAPGVNAGSSGPDTLVRDSAGSARLTAASIGALGDLVVGAPLDRLLSDGRNPWAGAALHGVPGGDPTLSGNSVGLPPTPNPPPLTLPVGLPLLAVRFDQDDLKRPPLVIQGAEVFAADGAFGLDDGSGASPVQVPSNALIQLNATLNPSNPFAFDLPAALLAPGAGTAFFQTGPASKWSTEPAEVLAAAGGAPGDVLGPRYATRQQIGHVLFTTDTERGLLLALNSNTLETLAELDLPDPHGLGLSPDLRRLYVSNTADDSLSVVDAELTGASFLTELARLSVGDGPTAVAASPDGVDVFVVDTAGDTITIVDAASLTVRKTLTSPLLDQPVDICLGLRETAGNPGFTTQTYHGYIANRGGDDVLVYESGPTGVAGFGFDDIIGAVPTAPGQELFAPTAVVFDPITPLDSFGPSVGCFVAHVDGRGQAVVSRVGFVSDTNPGQVIDTTQQRPNFGSKTFAVIQRYETGLAGPALDVALPDFDRESLAQEAFDATAPFAYNLGLAGAHPNGKQPWVPELFRPRWTPGRVYVSVAGAGLLAFDIDGGALETTVASDVDVTRLASYFSQ